LFYEIGLQMLQYIVQYLDLFIKMHPAKDSIVFTKYQTIFYYI